MTSKKIPDSSIKGSLERLLKIVGKLPDNDKKVLQVQTVIFNPFSLIRIAKFSW